MCGVAEGTVIGIVRRDDESPTARRKQPMEFFHQANHVTDVLNYMNRPDFPERIIPQWEWKLIKIREDVGAGIGVSIEADRARVLINTAPDIEDRQRF